MASSFIQHRQHQLTREKTHLQKLSTVRILPKVVVHVKKPTLSDVGNQTSPILGASKTWKITKIILEQRRLSRFLFDLRQWNYKRKEFAPNFKTPTDYHSQFQSKLPFIPVLDQEIIKFNLNCFLQRFPFLEWSSFHSWENAQVQIDSSIYYFFLQLCILWYKRGLDVTRKTTLRMNI